MTEKRFALEMQYWKTLPQGKQLVDNVTGEKGFTVEELCSIANGLYLQVEELKSANEVYKKCTTDLECENEQLKQSMNICRNARDNYSKRIVKLEKENEQLRKDRNDMFIRERDTKNEWRELKKENEDLKQQLNRLYNYFEDWHKDEMNPNAFSEMWDMVKENEKWERRW